MSDPIILEAFREWYENELDERLQEDVRVVIDLLAERGVRLGFPYSSDLKGSRYPLRELRIQSGGKPVRVFYAFDPNRDAVVILGGLKRDDHFYADYVPRAERLWEEYLGGS